MSTINFSGPVKLPVLAIVISCSAELLGTLVPTNAPLMAVGLDSIATTEFTSWLADHLGSPIPATMLFDHPTLDSVSRFLSTELETRTEQHVLRGCPILTAPMNSVKEVPNWAEPFKVIISDE